MKLLRIQLYALRVPLSLRLFKLNTTRWSTTSSPPLPSRKRRGSTKLGHVGSATGKKKKRPLAHAVDGDERTMTRVHSEKSRFSPPWLSLRAAVLLDRGLVRRTFPSHGEREGTETLEREAGKRRVLLSGRERSKEKKRKSRE